MSVKIQVFGTPYIEVNGEKLHLPLKKTEALIYYLAIEGKTGREKLACLLWGEKDEISAYNNFRNALYLIKRYFPEDFIISDRHSVSLANAVTDIDGIDNLCDISVSIPSNICYEMLEGFNIPESEGFGEWLLSSRCQFKEKIIDKIKIRATACYDAEDNDMLQNTLEKLVDLDPFDEDSILELMDLYFKRGRIAKGTTLFREYLTKLHDELGIKPSVRAEELFKRMLISGTGNEEKTGNLETFFLGRKKEQELILDKIRKSLNDKVVIFIDGEAGVGKTSLVQKMLSLIKDEKSMIFSTMSYEAGQDYPYSSWNDLVSQAAHYTDTEKLDAGGINLSLLISVFPNFMDNRRMIYNADIVRMSERTPIVIGRALSELVKHVSTDRNPILILEDLQWFDQQSLHLMEAFLGSLSIPVLVFITSRPEKSEYALRKLQRMDDNGLIELLTISLKPFDKTETASFCNIFLDKKLIESKDSDYFFRESEGLPLLVAELVKILSSNSDVELINAGLGGIMLARFGEIPEKLREFIRVLSIFTAGAQISTIAAVLGEPVNSIAIITEELLKRKLIKEVDTINGLTLLDFQHAKIRECLYESIPSFQRKEYHKKLADTLNLRYSPRTWDPVLSSMLCYHYTKAGFPEKVLEQHIREMIFDITLNHDLFPLIPDDVLFSCSLPFNDRADTEKKMDEMSDLLHTINRAAPNDPNEQKEILRMEASYLELRGGYLIGWGEYKEGCIFINRAMQMARQHGFNNVYIHCLQHTGHHFLQTDNWTSLLNCAREILKCAKNEEREKYMGIALRFIGVAFQIKGDFVSSEKVLRRSIEIFEEQALTGKQFTLSILAAECYIGENYYWQGNFDEAIKHYEKCIDTCEEKGLFWGCSHFHAHMADVAFDLNDMDLMYKHIYRGVEIFEKCQGGRCGSILYSLKAIADVKQGRYMDALKSIETGELLSYPIKKKSWIAVHVMAKAYLAEAKENGLLPSEFSSILTKSAMEYAAESVVIYSKIPVPHRQKGLAKRFGL